MRHARPLRVVGWFLVAAALMGSGLAAGWAADQPPQKAASFRYDAKGRRDPFISLVREGRVVGIPGGVSVSTASPILYGILWDPGGASIALVNDAEVKVGDTIGGYHVTEIRQDAVVLTNGGEPMVLQIAFEGPSSKLSPDTTMGGEGP